MRADPSLAERAVISPRPPATSHAVAVRLLHTSDVHVGDERRSASDGDWPESGIAALARLTALAREVEANGILIAGDLFDHNRVEASRVGMVAELFAAAGIPIVILPGNHDPHMAGGVYQRCETLFPSNVHVISNGEGELVAPEGSRFQVWGRAHVDYHDWSPVQGDPPWEADREFPRWRVAMAHGLYVRSEYEARLSYRIHAHEIDRLQAHYVALGHLEAHEPVGDPGAPAYYPGSLERSGGATMVDLRPEGLTVCHRPFQTGAVASAVELRPMSIG